MIVGAFEPSFPFHMVSSALPARTNRMAPTKVTATSTPTPAAQRNLKCGYPSRICTNERAWKRDGSLHRFCEEHRARANTNQKRWAQRKARTKADKATNANTNANANASANMNTKTNTMASTNTTAAEEYHVDESLLQATSPMDFSDFDMTLDLLLNEASFWSPTAAPMAAYPYKAQWEYDERMAPNVKEEDAMEAQLWAELGLGNVNMSL